MVAYTIYKMMKNNLEKYFKDITNIKEPAFIYLDVRTIQFNGNYSDAINQIKNFQVYWK